MGREAGQSRGLRRPGMGRCWRGRAQSLGAGARFCRWTERGSGVFLSGFLALGKHFVRYPGLVLPPGGRWRGRSVHTEQGISPGQTGLQKSPCLKQMMRTHEGEGTKLLLHTAWELHVRPVCVRGGVWSPGAARLPRVQPGRQDLQAGMEWEMFFRGPAV